MRIIKTIITVIVVVVILLFVGIFIFLKTVDLNRFKEQITAQISKSIHRDVNVRDVNFDFSFFEGIQLHISGLSVADLPEYSTEPMFYIDSAHLDVDVLSFVLKRQVLASEVEFDSPRINLFRNDKGVFNFSQLAKEEEKSKPKVTEEKKAVSIEKGEKKNPTKESKDFKFKEMLIRSIRITDGTFIFTDQMANPPMTIPVTAIEFQISNFSLEAPFPFELTASLFSKGNNIALNGLAQVDADNQQTRIDDLKIQTDFSDLSIKKIYEGIPPLREAGIRDEMEGKVTIDVHQMIVGAEGLLVLSADGRVTNANMQFKNSPIPIENLNMQFSMTESDVEIKEMKMPLASGEADITGRLIEYLAEQKFVADLKLNEAQLDELASQMELPVTLEGQAYANYQFHGQGLDGKALKTSLKGKGDFEIKNGRIKDVNLLKLILDKISFIPNLANQIEANLPQKYKDKLKARDTVLERVEVDTKIDQGVVFINQAQINADGFLVLANGKVDFDQNLSLSADFYIPSDLSQSMVSISKELKYFLDEQKRIHIPLRPYKGKVANFRMYPDVEDLGKEIIRNRGKEELKKVIFKALDIEEEKPQGTTTESTETPSGAPEGSSGESAPQEEPSSPEEAIIENILDMIPDF